MFQFNTNLLETQSGFWNELGAILGYLYQGWIQEFSIGAPPGAQLDTFESGGTWAPTHSQAPCLCKIEGRVPGDAPPPPFVPV